MLVTRGSSTSALLEVPNTARRNPTDFYNTSIISNASIQQSTKESETSLFSPYEYLAYSNQLKNLKSKNNLYSGNYSDRMSHMRKSREFQEMEMQQVDAHLEKIVPDELLAHYSKFQDFREHSKKKWSCFVEDIGPEFDRQHADKENTNPNLGKYKKYSDVKFAGNKERKSNVKTPPPLKLDVSHSRMDDSINHSANSSNTSSLHDKSLTSTHTSDNSDTTPRLSNTNKTRSGYNSMNIKHINEDGDEADLVGRRKLAKSDLVASRKKYYMMYRDALHPHFAGLNPKTADFLTQAKKGAILKWNEVDTFLEGDNAEKFNKTCEENIRLMNQKLQQHKCPPIPNLYNKRKTSISEMKRFKSESALPNIIPSADTSSTLPKMDPVPTVVVDNSTAAQYKGPHAHLRISRSTGFIETNQPHSNFEF